MTEKQVDEMNAHIKTLGIHTSAIAILDVDCNGIVRIHANGSRAELCLLSSDLQAFLVEMASGRLTKK
mgnify:CR=1 FL=1